MQSSDTVTSRFTFPAVIRASTCVAMLAWAGVSPVHCSFQPAAVDCLVAIALPRHQTACPGQQGNGTMHTRALGTIFSPGAHLRQSSLHAPPTLDLGVFVANGSCAVHGVDLKMLRFSRCEMFKPDFLGRLWWPWTWGGVLSGICRAPPQPLPLGLRARMRRTRRSPAQTTT